MSNDAAQRLLDCRDCSFLRRLWCIIPYHPCKKNKKTEGRSWMNKETETWAVLLFFLAIGAVCLMFSVSLECCIDSSGGVGGSEFPCNELKFLASDYLEVNCAVGDNFEVQEGGGMRGISH